MLFGTAPLGTAPLGTAPPGTAPPGNVRPRRSAALTVCVLVWLFGCDSTSSEDTTRQSAAPSAPSTVLPALDESWFAERAADTGLDFVHRNGATGDFLYPEILPPGVGLFDFDNDGDLDVFLVQGRMLQVGKTHADMLVTWPDSAPLGGRLYRNDLDPGDDDGHSLRFTDITTESGLTADGYGLGMATGDIDNDGWIDLLVTNFGPDQLFRNNGDGTFSDVTADAGIEAQNEFAVSAAFLDYDRDGWLDLYVGNNVDYRLDDPAVCPNPAGARDYCPPETYGGLPDRLYRNRGDGRFENVTDIALRHPTTGAVVRSTSGRFGPALGVVTGDYDADGWPDIYVANDGTENLLWMNQRDGTFRDAALLSGAAISRLGTPEASMGVGAGDFDNDGDDDLFMTHLMTEGNNLYVNDGSGMFQDQSARTGVGPMSLPYTGWGTSWFDFDNDGWLDLIAINGTVVAIDGRGDDPFPYGQRNTLFRNLGDGHFEDVSNRAGPAFSLVEVGRGAGFGDIDNDGDTDVLVGNNNGPTRLLINTLGHRHHWLGVRLVGHPPPTGAGPVHERDMLGARIAVQRAGTPTLWRRVHTDGSYASASDPRVVVGLGESAGAPDVQVMWPSGQIEVWHDLPVDRYSTLVEGDGAPLTAETP